MKKRKGVHRLLNLPVTRWSAYATASAATALAAAPEAEAAIHYSGPVHSSFHQDSVVRTFPLSGGADLGFRFTGSASQYYDAASFKVTGAGVSEAIRGHRFATALSYAVRLGAGAPVSRGIFFPQEPNRYANFGRYYSNGRWATPGVGFIGFEFNNGRGKQYGWARVRTKGKPAFTFIVEDYAWGDPGDVITAGQTEDAPTHVPATESLGWLALGGAGLAAWRRAKRGKSL